jgi:cytoskeletal protein RodZ
LCLAQRASCTVLFIELSFTLSHYAPVPGSNLRGARDAGEPLMKPPRKDGNSKMKNARTTGITVLMIWLLVFGSLAAHAQSAQQTGDPVKTDSNTSKPAEKTSADGAATGKNNSANNSVSTAASTAASPTGSSAKPPSSTTAAAQKTAPTKNGGLVWVNTDSGVYHRRGSRWYGRTKQGKYMTEADAIKAGYKASEKN